MPFILKTRRKAMKKKIIIISVVLIGFILALTSHSWAARGRGGPRYLDRGGWHQNWDKHPGHHYGWDRGGRHHPRYHRPAPGFRPGYRKWRHRPFYRHGYPKRFYRRHHRGVVNQINNYYGNVESDYPPEDQYQVNASVSDTGFSVSVGISGTD
jgi:hypothetical protein